VIAYRQINHLDM